MHIATTKHVQFKNIIFNLLRRLISLRLYIIVGVMRCEYGSLSIRVKRLQRENREFEYLLVAVLCSVRNMHYFIHFMGIIQRFLVLAVQPCG